jgi:uncharacterized damage-inducible protein DinB
MKRTLHAALLCLLFVALGATVQAQDVKGFRAEVLGNIEYSQKQVLDLENAIPDAKFTWRPNKDVRSINEVYSHIAFGNYLFGKFAGIPLPEGITINSPDDEKKFEMLTSDKKAIHDQLVKSFDFIKAGIKTLPDANLENMTEFFGQKMTVRSLLIILLTHMHEHLGQSIAYARMVDVVPPWTAARMATEKAKK